MNQLQAERTYKLALNFICCSENLDKFVFGVETNETLLDLNVSGRNPRGRKQDEA